MNERMKNFICQLAAVGIWNDFRIKVDNGEDYRKCGLFNIIDRSIDDPQLNTTLTKGQTLYRARALSEKDFRNAKSLGIDVLSNDITEGFNDINSGAAPLGIPSEGRNNIQGASYFYCSNDEGTALAETKPIPTSVLSLAQYNVAQDMSIIDFASPKAFSRTYSYENNVSLGQLYTFIMGAYTLPNKHYYRYSQIISEYIRNSGYLGVKYMSFYSGKENYSLFVSGKKYIQFQGSRLLQYRGSIETYWDFNSSSVINVGYENQINPTEDCMREVITRVRKNINVDA